MEQDEDDEIDPAILSMPAEFVNHRTQVEIQPLNSFFMPFILQHPASYFKIILKLFFKALNGQMSILRTDLQRITHNMQGIRDKIKENVERLKVGLLYRKKSL